MRSKMLDETNGRRTIALIMDKGDEVLSAITNFAAKEGIKAARISGIGAFSDVTLLYFDWSKKKYKKIAVDEQVEVASLNGDIALDPQGKPAVHVHLVVGKSDGTAMAGHLGAAHVRPTLELIVEDSPSYLQKTLDGETGLALIDIGEPAHA
jgi:predicted DNA-binding protein with PD1-like motif